MSILPVNKKQETIDTPHNFFIYGATMSGKSYFAEHFPKPLFLNTDGNAKQNPFPNIQLKNVKDKNGNLSQSALKDLGDIIFELQTTNKQEQFGYKTIIIDVIDDVCQLMEQAICVEAGVNSLADMGFGRGYKAFDTFLQNFVMDLKTLDLNIVYISRVEIRTDENNPSKSFEVPSLKTKYYNIVNGNCDLVVHTQKLGNNYIRSATDIRKKYYADKIDDPAILRMLKNIPGALKERPKETPKPQLPVTKK